MQEGHPGKSGPGHVDLSLPLDGTSDTLITGGPSAEHPCGKDRTKDRTSTISLVLTAACVTALVTAKLGEVQQSAQGHKHYSRGHMYIQVTWVPQLFSRDFHLREVFRRGCTFLQGE